MNAPFRPTLHPAPSAGECDNCCDLCCAVPVRTELDGDKLCQECADKWVRGQRPDEDDLLPLDHPVMREALTDWRLLYQGHRAFNRGGFK